MDWTNPRVSESVEEEEAKMSRLVFCFSTRMSKRVTNAQRETALGGEASDGKRPKVTNPNEEAHKSPTVTNVDSPDPAFDAQPDLEGAP